MEELILETKRVAIYKAVKNHEDGLTVTRSQATRWAGLDVVTLHIKTHKVENAETQHSASAFVSLTIPELEEILAFAKECKQNEGGK